MLELPVILNIPKKLYPVITDFNYYNYCLLDGGRGSAKSQSIARFLTYLGDIKKLRICCGRETQNSIEESVYQIFVNLIKKYKLNYEIKSNKIVHRINGTTIIFKGFKEQGSVNIKGLENIDILWIDEAQAITKTTLDIIIPTIRKPNSKIFFTMNRYLRNDAVYSFCAGSSDCLHIKINYLENEFCPQKLIDEANKCKARNYKDYKHIWLGEPLDQASDYLFSVSDLEYSKSIRFSGDTSFENKILSFDLAACGGDSCVAKLISQKSFTGWEERTVAQWSEPDTDITKGKIISLCSLYMPQMQIIDADGLGYPIWVSVKKVLEDCIGFRGAGKARLQNTLNQRADGYLTLNEYLQSKWLKITCENTIRQLEYIKKIYKPNGLVAIEDKKTIRETQGESPDFADTLMMAIYGINFFSHLFAKNNEESQTKVETDFDPF